MKRLGVFVAFIVLGTIVAYQDELPSEGEVLMGAFTLAGFAASLVIDNRTRRRIPVLMRGVFQFNATRGEGIVDDLSVRGCKLRSTTEFQPGVQLQLDVYPTVEDDPITVRNALVRWSSGGEFGVQFG